METQETCAPIAQPPQDDKKDGVSI